MSDQNKLTAEELFNEASECIDTGVPGEEITAITWRGFRNSFDYMQSIHSQQTAAQDARIAELEEQIRLERSAVREKYQTDIKKQDARIKELEEESKYYEDKWSEWDKILSKERHSHRKELEAVKKESDECNTVLTVACDERNKAEAQRDEANDLLKELERICQWGILPESPIHKRLISHNSRLSSGETKPEYNHCSQCGGQRGGNTPDGEDYIICNHCDGSGVEPAQINPSDNSSSEQETIS